MWFDYKKEINFFDDVMPFEKDIYIDMMLARLKDSGNNTPSTTNGAPPRREEFEK